MYRLGDFRSRLAAVCEQFATSWPQQLRRTHWRQVQALRRRIAAGEDGYGELQPVARADRSPSDVREFVEHPTRWAGVTPADEQQLSLFDHFSWLVVADVLAEARAALVQRSAEQ